MFGPNLRTLEVKALMIAACDMTMRIKRGPVTGESPPALTECERRYRSLFENMLGGYAYCQMLYDGDSPVDFVCLETNSALERLTGLRAVVGKKASEVLPGLRESNPEVFEIFGRVARGGQTEKFETYVKALDGWFSVAVHSPVRDHLVAVFDNITERKKTEASLCRSENRFRALFEAGRDAMLLLDRNGMFDCNQAAVELFQFSSPEELLAQSPSGFSPPTQPDGTDSRIAANRRIEAAYATGGQLFEWMHRRASGSIFPAEVLLSRVTLEGEEVLQAVIRDITHRKQTEARLRKLSRAVEQSPAIVVITDARGVIEYVNPRFIEVTGYTLAEAIGKTPRILRTEFTPRETHRDLWATIKQGKVWRGEFLNRKKNGDFFWEQAVVSPILGDDGRITHFVAVKEDITERKRSEESLRQNESRMTSLFRASPVGIGLARDRVIIEVNDQLCQITGYAREELLGQSTRMLYASQDDFEYVGRELYSRVHSSPVASVETHWRRKDGTSYDVLIHSSALDSSDQDAGITFTATDMTERKRLEAQLRQAQKLEAIGQLAGGVAHDFNNILAAQYLHLGLLQQRDDLPEEVADSLASIETGVRMASDLTRQLLAFSRRQVLEVQRLDFDKVISNLLKMLGRVLGEDVMLKFAPARSPVWLNADAGMLEQVVLNLVVNARDAMSKGGQLDIRTEEVTLPEKAPAQHPDARPGRFVRLTVTDTGCGMSPEVQQRIFEPFFTTKAPGKGTGLGLATVFGIVKQHQGWIELESQAGIGTTFSVYFPAAASPAAASVRGGNGDVVPRGTETLLLVEDEKPVRAAVRRALERLGYRVLDACDAIEAQRHWAQHGKEIRLMLTDMILPGGLTGLQLAKRFQNENQQLGVIICSGYSSEVVGDGCPSSSFLRLAKPFDFRKLAEVIRQELDRG